MYISSINFSLWCDLIERNFLEHEFKTLISDSIINGATSNPAIFKQSFLTSDAYKDDIQRLKSEGLEPKSIYENLAINDIKNAAKKLLPLYEKGDDGFVSIEIDPFLANDTQKSIEEGKRLYKSIDMPNVMIKVPATEKGYEVMRELIKDGININATLIFSPKQAKECVNALELGSKMFQKSHKNEELPKGVISVFVSRFDRKLDAKMDELNFPKAMVGIMNAAKIYHDIEKSKNKNIRTLFASTGVKGDELPPEYYIEKLLFPNTINTAPIATINAFVASGRTNVQTIPSQNEIELFFADLQEAQIDMQTVYDELLSEGLEAFNDAFKELLDTLS